MRLCLANLRDLEYAKPERQTLAQVFYTKSEEKQGIYIEMAEIYEKKILCFAPVISNGRLTL